jgi:hypothetical protein
MIQPEHPDRASRYVLMRDLSKLALVDGADGMVMVGEAWIASGENLPKSGFAADAPDRGEAIILHAASSGGEFISLQAVVSRRRWNSKKVKEIGPTEEDEKGFPFILSPFFREWGCLDEGKVARVFLQARSGNCGDGALISSCVLTRSNERCAAVGAGIRAMCIDVG